MIISSGSAHTHPTLRPTMASQKAPSPLHIVVWDNNLSLLKEYLSDKDADLEALDRNNNTPLLLAYRLGRKEAAQMLLAAGAYPKPRTPEYAFESIHVAALTADPHLTRHAVVAFLKETDAAFARRLPGLQAALEKLPDFTLRMSWDFSSWLPLVSRLLPSDTFVIYKRGSSIRLDSTLLQMNGLSWERGSLSILIWGSEMPVPGAIFVLDNEGKAAADARMAFTHPADHQQQDWVRKLLTAKQKTTDYWSRDTVLVPVRREGVLGSLSSAFSRAVLGDSSPKGRVSEGSKASSSSGAAGASASGSSEGNSPTPASPVHGFRGAAGADAATTEVVTPDYVDDPKQLREDVGVWASCPVYEMKNLCVRDVSYPAIQSALPLTSWWRPDYSLTATAEDVAASESAAKGGKTPAAAGAAAAGAVMEENPEAKMGILMKALTAISEGRVKEIQNAKSIDAVVGGAGPAGAAPAIPTASAAVMSFENYFGVPRPEPGTPASHAHPPGLASALGTRMHHIHEDGKCHQPKAAVCEHKKEALTLEDKQLNVRMMFSKEFPITPTQFLPVAELMARTTSHAANFRMFFERKMPKGAGFPVKFTLPVFPTITATVTFDYMTTNASPPKSMFEVPSDYSMGAYIEKGWIRQL